MPIQLQLGLDTIRSYKRLSYSPWHAFAEFVDNSTQNYFNYKTELDEAYESEGTNLLVTLVYDRDSESIRIADNAMGMDLTELDNALRVGATPENSSGRSEFGMGMKTAACWLGNLWTVRTKKLGSTDEHQVEVNVEGVADGDSDLRHKVVGGRDPATHYTVIDIQNLNHRFVGRTVGKIRAYLSSMYRYDLDQGVLTLKYNDSELKWPGVDEDLLLDKEGKKYKKNYTFDVNGKEVNGWVGVLGKGGRAKAGFSIMRWNRVIRGWPESWRPTTIYGQLEGSNDLINQRVVGEIHLNQFDVSHTKNDIIWMGDEEDQVLDKLKEACADYVRVASEYRKGAAGSGPNQLEVDAALDELSAELTSPESVDLVQIEDVPPPEVIDSSLEQIRSNAEVSEPTFLANVGTLEVRLYLDTSLSINDPYVVIDSAETDSVAIVVNWEHPHVSLLSGSEGVANYLRHCIYDGVAEWKVRQSSAQIDPDAVKLIKDRFLRLTFEMNANLPDADGS